MKVLLYDIETAPNVVRSWGVYETDALEVLSDWHLLCFSWKWAHLKETHVLALPDLPGYVPGATDDRALAEALWKLFDEADVLIAHNGDKFDWRKTRTRFVVNGLPPPSPSVLVDTKKLAKSQFGFDSNKLDELGRQLGIGRKAQTGGYGLWQGCMAGDMKAWATMKKYNKQDVILLSAVYEKLQAWSKNPPNWNLFKEMDCCPSCGSVQIQKRGLGYTRTSAYQRYQCQRCWAWSRGAGVERRTIR